MAVIGRTGSSPLIGNSKDPALHPRPPEGKRKYADRVKKTLQRARKAMLDAELIGVDQVGGEHPYHIVWPTGRAVWGPGLQWPEDGRRQPRDALAEETGSIADLWGGGQD